MSGPAHSPLFEPISLGNLSLANRVAMAPMTRGQSPRNVPTEETARYYRRRAEGGAGLLITECTFIEHPTANGFTNAPAFYGDDSLAGWRRVVEQVHEAGAKIVPQIWHAGPSREIGTSPNGTLPSIGPMDISRNGRPLVKAMTQKDINDVIHGFAKAAADAKSLGFDGVEVHGAHSYLLDQFLWEKSNKRGDCYGGSIGNRVRLACEVVEAMRSAVGEGFPIIFRFSQWKLTDYHARIAHSGKELEQFLLPLAHAGVDIFHASTRRFWEPAFPGSELSLAGWAKKITAKPVIAVGSVGIDKPFSLENLSEQTTSQPSAVDLVEQKLRAREFDLVAVGRAILADPNWPRKIRNGQLGDIIPFRSESLAALS